MDDSDRPCGVKSAAILKAAFRMPAIFSDLWNSPMASAGSMPASTAACAALSHQSTACSHHTCSAQGDSQRD